MNQMPVYTTMDDAYHDLYAAACRWGFAASPRGKACIELRPAVFSLRSPREGLFRGGSRRLNYRFFAIEAMQYIAGWGSEPEHAELLLAANKNLSFALNEETGTFDGAYGPRLQHSLPLVADVLRKDPWTRQAVCSIWAPGFPPPSRDVPCTCLLHFYCLPAIGEAIPRLAMTAYMRSNDLNWGTPYDVAAFCAIQCAVADDLGWELGHYTHFAGSLHFYEDGNSAGERPPTLLPHEQDVFLRPCDGAPGLGGPPPAKAGASMRHVTWACSEALWDVYEQRVRNKAPWEEVRAYIEGESALVKWFMDLIRWRWPK